jgi:dihydrodipicolinate reductase
MGRGKLATELLQGLSSPSIEQLLPWQERAKLSGGRVIVVHAGSGRELADALDYCSQNHATLLELSTAATPLPPAPDFPLVVCPNVNMQMLAFMAMLQFGARFFKGHAISITESHQATKTTAPGTAQHIAASLGVDPAAITSLRDATVQRDVLGIPEQFLARHALHRIEIDSGDVSIRLETRVLGKSAYASGLAEIVTTLAQRRVAAGIHSIVDLISTPPHP